MPLLVYVPNVNLIFTVVPAVFWLASDKGGVQLILVDVVNPVAEPAT